MAAQEARERASATHLHLRAGHRVIPVFHITHIDNLTAILTQGGLASHNECVSQGVTYRRIGDAALKDTRSTFLVRVPRTVP